jgi:hypothetical protein
MSVEICMNSGSAALDACATRIFWLGQFIEAQYRVTLLQLSLPA